MSVAVKPYKTLKSSSEAEFKEKGSLFRGIIIPVKGQSEAMEHLENLRKKYYDATHHCYAWRLKDDSFKYSDDGEPSGTAGKRILNAIDHYELKDVICVVIRWYGGTKLGTGPLGKAYYTAAEEAVKNGKIANNTPFCHYIIKVPYEYSRQFYHLLDKYMVRIENKDYTGVPEYNCLIPYNKKEDILKEILTISGSRIEVVELDKISFILDATID